MKRIRIVSLLLAVMMLCTSFLIGCADGEADKGDAGEVILNTSGVDNSKILDLPKKDLNGHEFRIIGVERDGTPEFLADTLTGDKLNDAVFTRNAQIEKDYNCKIVFEKNANPSATIREPLMAGEYVCDFVYDVARQIRPLAGANMLYDVTRSNNINLEKAWYDQNAINGMNVGGKVFFLLGDAALWDDLSTFLTRINFDFLKEYDSEIDLYQEVRDGKWTIDRMYELVTATAKDKNGDGLLMPGEDRFGYNAEPAVNFAHVAACGVTVSNRDDSGNFELPLTPKQELLDAWAALKPLLTTPARLNDWRGLADGMCTFYCCNTSTLLSTMASPYDIGVLPMPKLNEEQENYYTTVYFSQITMFAIPMTADNAEDAKDNGFESGTEQAAYFFEVLSYYSMNIITPAFFDQVLMKQAIRDPEAAEMVEIAIENKLFDPVVGYNFGGMYMFNDIGSPGKRVPGSDINYDTLVSTYEARVPAARMALQNYLNYINTGDLDAI